MTRLILLWSPRASLRPHPAEPDETRGIIQAVLPSAFVLNIRWAGQPASDHGFVVGDVAMAPNVVQPSPPVGGDTAGDVGGAVLRPSLDRGQRIAMVLEYIDDVAPPDQAVVLFLPLDDLASVEDLLAAAAARWGATRIATRRLALSTASEDVLRELGAKTPADDGPAVVADQLGLPLPAAWIRNYTLAVLRLAERRLAATSLFATDRRAERVTMLLEASGLLIRPNVPADQILRELEPGGELFLLLTRPTPPPLSLFSSPEVA